MLKYSFTMLIIVFSGSIFAGCSPLGCTSTVGTIYLHPDGDVKVSVNESIDETSSLACTLFEGRYFSLKSTNTHAEKTYKMLVTAKIEGMNVYFRAIENSADCEIWYTTLNSNY
ncbi:MAG: hypothetical protein ACJAS1_005780 [Oleiphilaceae bacterium]|jgi:hypothetical protein